LPTLRAWIDEGAVWPETPAAPANGLVRAHRAAPAGAPEGGEEHPIDRFVAAYFAKHAMAFPAAAGDALYARRVYYDLWGLPPTPEQLDAFVRDSSADKRARLIDALLGNSQLYAENWVSWWNDLLRNDMGGNYQGERKSITDWLVRALERNLPYDQMIAALVNPVAKTTRTVF
jgi:hypothetical protein